MAKRKNRNKGFAQRQANLANKQQRATQQRQMLTNILGFVAAGLVLVGAFVFLPQFFGQNEEVPAPGSATAELVGDQFTISDQSVSDLDPAQRDGFFNSPPSMVIDTDKSYQAVIQTEKGPIRLELYDDEAPITVNNFVYLSSIGFYDDTTFHRVINNFMAQAGDPSATGRGGPGYRFQDETVGSPYAFDSGGILAMANAGPNTNGSQFFITYEPTPHLNGGHTIFGRIIEGADVLDQIRLRDPATDPNPGDLITTIEIYEQ